jgi:hypothetical protein
MPHIIEATFDGSSVLVAKDIGIRKLLLDSEQKVYRLVLCALGPGFYALQNLTKRFGHDCL